MSSTRSLIATVFTILGILIGSAILAMGVLMAYQKYFGFNKKFDISMHFENPSSSLDNAQVEMCRQPEVAATNYYNQIYVNNQVGVLDVMMSRERKINFFLF